MTINKKNFWQGNGFIGLLISGLFFILIQADMLRGLDPYLYQVSMYLSPRPANEDLVLIDVDAEGFNSLLHSQVLAKLNQTKVRLLVDTLPLYQQESSQAQQLFQQLFDFYEASYLVNGLQGRSKEDWQRSSEVKQLSQYLAQLGSVLNTQPYLAAQMRQLGEVILSAPIEVSQQAQLLPELSAALDTMSVPVFLPQWQPSDIFPYVAAIQMPLPLFTQATDGLGLLPKQPHTALVPLIFSYQDKYLPHLALLVTAHLLNLSPKDINTQSLSALNQLGYGIRLGEQWLSTDEHLQIQAFNYQALGQEGQAFLRFSASDILDAQFDVSQLNNKVVLLGFSHASYSGSWQGRTDGLLQLANTISTLTEGHMLQRPSWANGIEMTMFIVVCLYLVFLLPLLRGGLIIGVNVVLSLVLLATQILLAIDLIALSLLPLFLLLWTTHLILMLKSLWFINPLLMVDDAAVRTHRLQGLTLQSQGKLQQAFDTFIQCPIDDLILSLLYNLGLDFERKQQPKQALAVYRHMLNHVADFRDINQRIERLSYQPTLLNATQASILGEHLGRYLVKRELGKGAMGQVYLGKDPKLNRLVALKTLKLSLEFAGRELEEATARFFREASAAGRLAHPNIVSVYDAGEEGDLAYIAMEYFEGGDLSTYTRADDRQLLPLETVLELAVKVAEALHYAHSQGVVHRDIKPANILYNLDTGQIKLTDFGIARITDSKKTRTGVLLGTPSYMSPEQLEGKHLDGRSDLFSFGVMLYQLLSGKLPFNADSMASLMFKIIHENPRDLSEVNSDLPPCIKSIIDSLLQKDPDLRYPTGHALAQALQTCTERVYPGFIEATTQSNNIRRFHRE